jgi:anaerobic selenocysteine-containing dehydrogenase
MIATVEDERLVALRADKEHPISKGFVCNKGIYGLDIHNDPDRLKAPQKRTSNGLADVGWGDALQDISTQLKDILATSGPGAIGAYTGNPTAFNSLYGPSFGNFVRQLGTRKLFSSGTQDCANKFAGSEAVFGTRTLHPLPDIDQSDFILIIGENPAVSHMSFCSIPNPMEHLKAAEQRGAKILYVNPREIESAKGAGSVLKIKPDTDVYLLAALINEVHREIGFHPDTRLHGEHVEELLAVVERYPAERVAGVTGIDAAAIKSLAVEFGRAPSAAAHLSTGVNMGRQGTLAYWLLHMLVFVTGNLGKPGGNFYSLGFYQRSPLAGRFAPEGYLETPFGTVRKPGGVGIGLPGNLLADYITNPAEPLRALFVNSGNPVLSIGGEARTREALKSLELLVCVDIYPNATAEYAHYLLPAAGAFEREDINLTGLGMQFQPSVQFTEAVVPPAYERKPDWWIYEKLSQTMGFECAFDTGPEPDMWARTDAMLRSQQRSMGQLRQEQIIALERSKPEDFSSYVQHDDKHIDCCPAAFAEALIRMEDLFNQLRAEPASQLKLISKRDPYMMNSWYSNLPKLKANNRDRNYLYMHPEDAAQRQIADGDQVRISNANGAIAAQVKVTDELMAGVVAMTHGWGHTGTLDDNRSGMRNARAMPGVNCNALMPSGADSFEPISNQAHLTGIPVEVAPL